MSGADGRQERAGVGASDCPRVGSLFSGIGGFDLGLEQAGMEVVWQCEIDKDARTVLANRWPDVPVYDDVTALKGADVAAVDVLCGGFPCQDLSVAGRRAGLAGERSGLFHEFMRLAGELAPRWVLIENVPGLLSSNGGRDMGVVLGVLADLGYGWCYRVLDAQYFGVAQRRRRVFIVGHLGDAAGAAQVLLEPACCGGDSPPSRTAGARVAPTLEAGANRTGGVRPPGTTVDTADSLVRCGNPLDDQQTGQLIAFHQTQEPITERGREPALGATSIGMGVAYSLAVRGREDGQEWELGDPDIGNALRAGDGGSSRGNWALIPFDTTQITSALNRSQPRAGDPCHPLAAGAHAPAVASPMAVRRLTPVECERLQGFPDGWTAGLSDSARYRTLGNAVCVPVAEWIGRRIIAALTGASRTSSADAPPTPPGTPRTAAPRSARADVPPRTSRTQRCEDAPSEDGEGQDLVLAHRRRDDDSVAVGEHDLEVDAEGAHGVDRGDRLPVVAEGLADLRHTKSQPQTLPAVNHKLAGQSCALDAPATVLLGPSRDAR